MFFYSFVHTAIFVVDFHAWLPVYLKLSFLQQHWVYARHW